MRCRWTRAQELEWIRLAAKSDWLVRESDRDHIYIGDVPTAMTLHLPQRELRQNELPTLLEIGGDQADSGVHL
jgi:hypothetical protein